MARSFKRNIIIGFGISLLLLILSSVASFVSIRSLVRSSGWVDHTYKVITELESINTLLLEIETMQRGFMLSGDPEYLESYQTNTASLQENIENVGQLTADNISQQRTNMELASVINARLRLLDEGIRLKRENQVVNNTFLIRGNEYMDQARALLDRMEDEENQLLLERTKDKQQLSNYTPAFIVLAALISLAITSVFYGRVMADYKQRLKLQRDLEKKDDEISRRLAVIRGIADKVSQGNYAVRVEDNARDLLGSLAGSLNKMAQSLGYSFGLLSDKEWLQKGLAELNQRIQGDKDVEELASIVLDFVTEYTDSKVAALYLWTEAGRLQLVHWYAIPPDAKKEVALGEGIVGQCAAAQKIIQIDDIFSEDFTINFVGGRVIPSSVIAIPLLQDTRLKGAMELGTTGKYTKNDFLFFDAVSGIAGTALHSAQSRRKMQELLEETQSQAEELQVQHSELENINEELKSQTQRLQVSEEELKVQQEELMQTNVELEERTTMLEEKNQMIEERNQDILQKARELELSTRYKSEFMANMSHELRTPLNSILLLSRILSENSEGNLDKDQVESARVIQYSGQGLLALIDEILDLSKIESGKMEVELQQVAVAEITSDVEELFSPLAKEKKIEFGIQIEDGVPASITTDKLRVIQILRNLIANAIKFTSKGSVKVNVQSNASEGGGQVIFRVRDTGIGIPADKQRLVFEAFQQADGSTRRQYGGTGLGLSISRELARLLDGRVELESEAGKGSEFRLVLPLTPSPVQADAKPHLPLGPAARERQEADNRAMLSESPQRVLMTEDDTADKMSEVFFRIEDVLKQSPGKVLIMDENERHARALSYFLENFQINPELSGTVEDAISRLHAKERACVILDAGERDGHTASIIEQVKASEGLSNLPIILFTGKSLSKTEEVKLKQLVNSIVVKTAHSYQRILDEVSLYLHLVENRKQGEQPSPKKLGRLREVLEDKQVLIADDDVRNIFSLSKALESYGMNIISATDGREALEQLKTHPAIRIILMDMMMPDLDGYETMKQIRNMNGYSKIPIIAVTAKAMAGDREKCIQSGASDYITKPIDKDQLLSLLRVWLYDRV